MLCIEEVRTPCLLAHSRMPEPCARAMAEVELPTVAPTAANWNATAANIAVRCDACVRTCCDTVRACCGDPLGLSRSTGSGLGR